MKMTKGTAMLKNGRGRAFNGESRAHCTGMEVLAGDGGYGQGRRFPATSVPGMSVEDAASGGESHNQEQEKEQQEQARQKLRDSD